MSATIPHAGAALFDFDSTVAAGLNVIDVPTFIRLFQFYNSNSNMYAQYAQLREISMQDIPPHVGDGRLRSSIPRRAQCSRCASCIGVDSSGSADSVLPSPQMESV
jgi:hypothetical protein